MEMTLDTPTEPRKPYTYDPLAEGKATKLPVWQAVCTSYQLAWHKLPVFFSRLCIVMAAVIASQLVLAWAAVATDPLVALVVIFVSSLLSGLITMPYAIDMSRIGMGQSPFSANYLARLASPTTWRLVGKFLLLFLLMIPLSIVISLGATAFAAAGSTIGAAIWSVLFGVVGLYVLEVFFLTAPGVAVGAKRPIRVARRVVWANFFRILLSYLPLVAPGFLVMGVFFVLMPSVFSPMHHTTESLIGLVLYFIIVSFVSLPATLLPGVIFAHTVPAPSTAATAESAPETAAGEGPASTNPTNANPTNANPTDAS